MHNSLNMARRVVLLSFLLFGCVGGVAQGAGTIFPTTKGSSWSYQYSHGGPAFTQTITASTPTHFTEKQTGSVAAVMHFKRSPQGWVSADLGNVQIRKMQGRKIKIKIVRTSGVVIPKTSLWKPGYQWKYAMTDKSTASSGPFVVLVHTTVASHLTITGFRHVTVPAGKFKCCRVKVTEDITSVVAVAGQVQTRHMRIKMTEYYARGVGLVERSSNHMVAQLTHYKIAR